MQAQKLKQIMKRAMVLVLAAVSLFSAVFCAVPMTSTAQAASGTGLSCNVKFSQRNESNAWSVKVGTRSGYKQANT